VLEIPPAYRVQAVYFIAPVSAGDGPSRGEPFIELTLSAAGEQILSRYGFGPAEPE
jgi:hypothetical protein